MSESEAWYIVKQANGQCAIVAASSTESGLELPDASDREHWGPYASQQEAIARRVGLIRAGKCQPS
jgi:hypothetical protein